MPPKRTNPKLDMPMVRIVFRADSGKDMGLGHVVRSLALAEMLRRDFEVWLATTEVTEFLKEEISSVCHGLKLIEVEDEFYQFLRSSDIVVVDGYHFTDQYLQLIRSLTGALVCIKDFPHANCPADMIINHSPYARPDDYASQEEKILLLGWKYALLRKPFREAATISQERTSISSLLICMGGTDPLGLTGLFSNIAIKAELFQSINVILPNYSRNHFKAESERVRYFKDLDAVQMATLMSQSDVLLAPSSTICIEGLATKINLITLYYSENQRQLFEFIVGNGLGVGVSIPVAHDLEQCSSQFFSAIEFFGKKRPIDLLPDGNQGSRFLKAFHELTRSSKYTNINQIQK